MIHRNGIIALSFTLCNKQPFSESQIALKIYSYLIIFTEALHKLVTKFIVPGVQLGGLIGLLTKK